MLFYSVFQTYHRNNKFSRLKSLNPEGPLSSYLSDVALPALSVTCQFLFLWNKENKQDFLLGEKKKKKDLVFLSFLWSIFLVRFLMFLYHSFHRGSIIFIESVFHVLLFFIFYLLYMLPRLFYLSSRRSCSV